MVRDTTERKQVERLLEHLNAELERQVQERTTQLQQALEFEASLRHVADKVRDSLDESQILRTAVRELALVLGLVCCDTALYDIAHGTAHNPTHHINLATNLSTSLATSTIRYEFTPGEDMASPSALGQVISMATLPETYRQLIQGEYFQFCEIDPHSLRHLAILACPIADDQGVLGDLWLFKRREDAFNELEVRLAQQIANQCAIAIRQARLYQASQVRIEEMKKLDRLKDSFLSTTSHELRSPVANMRMAIRVLRIALAQERAAALNAEAKSPRATNPEIPKTEAIKLEKAAAVDRYLQILDTECDREISMINNLLDFQRLEAGEHPLLMQPIDLKDWLPPIVAPFQARSGDRQQTLCIDLAPNLPKLASDSAILERILAELLNNACKYTPLKGQIVIRVQAQPHSMQIIVSNTSLDIPARELDRIFDKFYRLPNADPWKQGGTGLGLALVQKLTEHLGGKITVESLLGQLHFTVDLPFADLPFIEQGL